MIGSMVGGVEKGNPASIRVLEKNGFVVSAVSKSGQGESDMLELVRKFERS